MTKGSFIVFEGIDGSGTSTHVHRLAEKIEAFNKYQDVLKTHEPWRNDEIKRRLERERDAYSNPLEMAELYTANRADHVRSLIRPTLETGTDVLCSRFKMSTCTYQWAQGMPLQDLLKMHEHRGILLPDLTFFLTVPREVAQERIRTTRSAREKFERDQEFIDKLIVSYGSLVNLAQVDPRIFGPVVIIDSTKDIEEVADQIFQKYKEKLNF